MIESKNDILTPIWSTDTVLNETAMFLSAKDRVPLLFKPQKILSVTSYDNSSVYTEGEDFILDENGRLVLTENSRIPAITEEEYYSDDPSSILVTLKDGKEVRTYWGEGTIMTKWQILVSYTHEGFDGCPVPPSHTDRYQRLLSKFENGENVTVLFLGDSITAGASASFHTNTHPYMLSWPELFCNELAKRYGYTVKYVDTKLPHAVKVPENDAVYGDRGALTYINTAVGGWKIYQGIENFEQRVTKWIDEYGCDLFVLGFGMNDKKYNAQEETDSMRLLFDRVLELSPQTSLLAVSTMIPNPEAVNGWFTMQDTFEDAMLEMADEYHAKGIPCAIAPVTNMSRFVNSRKRFRDITGNNINHPNDFMVRIYAQTLLKTVLG